MKYCAKATSDITCDQSIILELQELNKLLQSMRPWILMSSPVRVHFSMFWFFCFFLRPTMQKSLSVAYITVNVNLKGEGGRESASGLQSTCPVLGCLGGNGALLTNPTQAYNPGDVLTIKINAEGTGIGGGYTSLANADKSYIAIAAGGGGACK